MRMKPRIYLYIFSGTKYHEGQNRTFIYLLKLNRTSGNKLVCFMVNVGTRNKKKKENGTNWLKVQLFLFHSNLFLFFFQIVEYFDNIHLNILKKTSYISIYSKNFYKIIIKRKIEKWGICIQKFHKFSCRNQNTKTEKHHINL